MEINTLRWTCVVKLMLPVIMAASLSSTQVTAAEADTSTLLEMDMAQLMNVEVTTIDKWAMPLDDAAAAVTVLSSEDILRSGMQTVPELMRMVPGMQVARTSASAWAISARGFNGTFARTMLVMVDGRSIYTPLTSGVDWFRRDLLLENIKRIEVIRGPGGAIWGANAMTGVINIITKKSLDTQGILVAGSGGNRLHSMGKLRYGGELGYNTSYRISGRYAAHGRQMNSNGLVYNNDDWDQSRIDFRIDSRLSSVDHISLQGARNRGTLHNIPSSGIFSGSHLMGEWQHDFSEESALRMQAYVDQTKKETFKQLRFDHINTYDFDMSHHFKLAEQLAVNWGLGYRKTRFNNINTTGANPLLSYHPAQSHTRTYRGFVQARSYWHERNVQLTLGSKFENNSYTGFEYQPSAQLLWHIEQNHTIWGAISRTVSTPTRFDDAASLALSGLPFPFPPSINLIQPNPDLESQVQLSYEAGYRGMLADNLHLSLSLFFNRYKRLSTSEDFGFFGGIIGNGLGGSVHGGELTLQWQASKDWLLKASYSHINMESLKPESWSTARTAGLEVLQSNARNMASLQSRLDLPWQLQFDSAIYYVASLQAAGGIVTPAYNRVDARIAWSPNKQLQLSLAANDLFDKSRPQYLDSTSFNLTDIGRSFHAQATYNYD
ncbi:iron complex outermembrane recepter protein [Mariprofundus micogutta]|uniref:Iron complex outermembrane recepter protein n=1 Tax=Mariprofundus micogutta TaxID=1921010 RepID=A0A1L8CQ67_9PROT|nr:TonB-dependent receptor [Mariprofundus micogutta]GAV21072.1 iron complex outermembrane recepter protein [Mariprofundus micogutta]